MNDYRQLLRNMPREVNFGYGRVIIWRSSELAEGQLGYSVHPNGTNLCGDRAGSWHHNWFVIGQGQYDGDPVFIDTEVPGYPVFTAWHGQGRWDPKQIAVSLVGLRTALLTVARASRRRQSPEALEKHPLSAAEYDRILHDIQFHNPGIDLSFWRSMLTTGEDPH